MFVGLIVFSMIMFGLGMLMNKFIDKTVGFGLCIRNNEKWGIDTNEKK